MTTTLFNVLSPIGASEAEYDPDDAARLIYSGRAPVGMRVNGHLSLERDPAITELPAGLIVPSLDVSGCPKLRALPAGLQTRRIDASDCRSLVHIPKGLRCYELDLSNTAIETLPGDIQVDYRLNLAGCMELRSLPTSLKTGSLLLQECHSLERLPEGIDVYFLDISGCTGLRSWPERGSLQVGRLNARGCSGLRNLPDWMTRIAQIDLRGCSGIMSLPEDL